MSSEELKRYNISGIPLIKSLMDSVEYSRKSNNMNELIIVKKINNKQ